MSHPTECPVLERLASGVPRLAQDYFHSWFLIYFSQAWSGDPHPALAQVPRTPQQIQHLQRLQMQRQQVVEGGAAPVEQVVGTGSTAPQQTSMMPQQAGVASQAGPQPGIPSQAGIAGKPPGIPVQGGMMTAQMQQQRMLQQQQQNPNNTKAALQNMLTTRMGPGGQPLPPSASVSMAPDGTAANRLQMMNQQLQQGGMMPSPQHSPQQQAIIQQQQQQVRLCCMPPLSTIARIIQYFCLGSYRRQSCLTRD